MIVKKMTSAAMVMELIDFDLTYAHVNAVKINFYEKCSI